GRLIRSGAVIAAIREDWAGLHCASHPAPPATPLLVDGDVTGNLQRRIEAFGVENYNLDEWLTMYGRDYLEAQLDRLEEMRATGRLIRSGAVIAAIREDWAGYTQAVEEPQPGA
ncbi:MAG: hypothetical protein HY335_10125, partial [Deinococcus sp.]|nr:hypothetical protein [Deinococcus sp.]